jgi:hypothetical protein
MRLDRGALRFASERGAGRRGKREQARGYTGWGGYVGENERKKEGRTLVRPLMPRVVGNHAASIRLVVRSVAGDFVSPAPRTVSIGVE